MMSEARKRGQDSFFSKRSEMVGPTDECRLDDCALDSDEAARLWTLSEQKTSLSWSPQFE